MSQYALAQLGISAAIHIEKTQWGLVQKRVLQLSKIQDGALLYFKPFAQWQQLQESRLWQAMPVVRNNRVGAVPATWSYGGAMSLKYLAQSMASALLTIARADTPELDYIQAIKAVK
jgi:iron complex transport system substrate-binding protein